MTAGARPCPEALGWARRRAEAEDSAIVAKPRRSDMGRRVLALTLAVIWLATPPLAPAQQSDDDQEHPELAKALKDAKVSLQSGLQASAREGTPISAKYELEEGKLQLSVYTKKGDKFSEVIVDHKTGKVAKAEPITKAEDMTAAKDQSAAMAKAKRSLAPGCSEAVKANKGWRVSRECTRRKDRRR